MIIVTVDFQSSRNPKLSQLTQLIPQFFDENLNPIRVPNLYLRNISTRLAKKSLLTSAEHMKEFLTWTMKSNLKTEDINDDIFDNYIDALCSYRKPTGDPLSWNTVNSRVSGAYRYLLWSYDRGFCPNLNPFELKTIHLNSKQKYKAKGHVSKPLKSPISFLQLDDAVKFIDSLAIFSKNENPNLKQRNKLMGAFMLQTGVRVSEVSNFPLKDLPEINHKGHSTPARVIGKGNKARVILIPNSLLIKLWEYVDIDREKIAEASENCIKVNIASDTLFLTEKAQKISVNWIQKLFRTTSKYTGIKSNPHILRHTFATYHYLLNRDLTTLSKLLGHSSETTTHLYYVHTATLVSYSGSYTSFQEEIDRLIEVSFE
jgi:integrase/recombinase XerD